MCRRRPDSKVKELLCHTRRLVSAKRIYVSHTSSFFKGEHESMKLNLNDYHHHHWPSASAWASVWTWSLERQWITAAKKWSMKTGWRPSSKRVLKGKESWFVIKSMQALFSSQRFHLEDSLSNSNGLPFVSPELFIWRSSSPPANITLIRSSSSSCCLFPGLFSHHGHHHRHHHLILSSDLLFCTLFSSQLIIIFFLCCKVIIVISCTLFLNVLCIKSLWEKFAREESCSLSRLTITRKLILDLERQMWLPLKRHCRGHCLLENVKGSSTSSLTTKSPPLDCKRSRLCCSCCRNHFLWSHILASVVANNEPCKCLPLSN